MDDKQHVIGHQTTGRSDLNRKEISGGHHVPVRFQERRPRGAFLSLRCRFYAVPFQYILDRVRRNDVADISQRALYSVGTPGGILPRHAEYQIDDLLREARSPRPLPVIGPLLRDELTVPGEQRIGCHQRLQFIKCPATQHFGLHGQAYPLFVGESKPLSFELHGSLR